MTHDLSESFLHNVIFLYTFLCMQFIHVYKASPINATAGRNKHKKSADMEKGKATPLQALTGPEGSRRLRLPGFKTAGT
jgi:hypothetical protein